MNIIFEPKQQFLEPGQKFEIVRISEDGIVARPLDSHIYTYGNVKIDFVRFRATEKDEAVHLTTTDWALLKLLNVSYPALAPIRQLTVACFGEHSQREVQNLRVVVGRVRRQFKTSFIVNHVGIGYRLISPDEPEAYVQG